MRDETPYRRARRIPHGYTLKHQVVIPLLIVTPLCKFQIPATVDEIIKILLKVGWDDRICTILVIGLRYISSED
jgi:hypothetical protein